MLVTHRQWLDEKMHNKMLEQQLNSNAVYEVEVKTGGMKVCGLDNVLQKICITDCNLL